MERLNCKNAGLGLLLVACLAVQASSATYLSYEAPSGCIQNVSKHLQAYASLYNTVHSLPTMKEIVYPKPDPVDKVFVDLRTTGCIAPVRDQGDCKADNIFATVAMWEYWHCRITGKLEEFSEQPALDCGRQYFNLKGCQGGDYNGVHDFYRMCGLELREAYPYKGAEGNCPHDLAKQEERNMMGWWRYFGTNPLVPVEHGDSWTEKLNKGKPLLVTIYSHPTFGSQGNQVDNADGCSPAFGTHTMLLVGHGLEKGREYWLFKNSQGASWGEDGYYKMDKYATERCMVLGSGKELEIVDYDGLVMTENGFRNGVMSYSIPYGEPLFS